MSAESTTPAEPAAALGRVRDLAERFEAYGMTVPTWKLRAAIDGRPGIPPAPSPASGSDEEAQAEQIEPRLEDLLYSLLPGKCGCCEVDGRRIVDATARAMVAAGWVSPAALAAHEAEVLRLREVLAAARVEIKASSDADTALILTSCTCDYEWHGEGSAPHRDWCNWVLAAAEGSS